jgi:hypothetical protein
MPAPEFTMAVLKDMSCEASFCDHSTHGARRMLVNPVCHPGQGNEVEFAGQAVHIRCRVCQSPIASFKVADR